MYFRYVAPLTKLFLTPYYRKESCDLKVINKAYITKYCCFICEWDSKAHSLHYSRKVWLARKSLEPGIMNVENQPLLEPSKVLLPSMHLNLDLIKYFVKAMNQDESAFTYL
jgi:hypothetical protein